MENGENDNKNFPKKFQKNGGHKLSPNYRQLLQNNCKRYMAEMEDI